MGRFKSIELPELDPILEKLVNAVIEASKMVELEYRNEILSKASDLVHTIIMAYVEARLPEKYFEALGDA